MSTASRRSSGTGIAKKSTQPGPRWRRDHAGEHRFIAGNELDTKAHQSRLASIMEDCNG